MCWPPSPFALNSNLPRPFRHWSWLPRVDAGLGCCEFSTSQYATCCFGPKDPSDDHIGGCKTSECLDLADCVKKCNSCGGPEYLGIGVIGVKSLKGRGCVQNRQKNGKVHVTTSSRWTVDIVITVCSGPLGTNCLSRHLKTRFVQKTCTSLLACPCAEVHVQECCMLTTESHCIRIWAFSVLCKQRMLGYKGPKNDQTQVEVEEINMPAFERPQQAVHRPRCKKFFELRWIVLHWIVWHGASLCVCKWVLGLHVLLINFSMMGPAKNGMQA